MTQVRDNLDTIESLGNALVERTLPDLNAAALAMAEGSDPDQAFFDLRVKLAEAVLILHLLGYAARRRPLARRGIVPKVDRAANTIDQPVAMFARFAEPELVRLPFLRALERFRSDVPELASVVARAQAAALETARRSVERSRRALQVALTRIEIPETVGALGEVGVAGEAFREAVAIAIGREGGALLDTEVRTTLMSGFNAGGKAAIEDNIEAVPITQLSEIQDRRTRGNPRGESPDAGPHFQMDGFAAASDDPVWDSITPPNGWNCRGSTRGVPVAEALRRRWARRDNAGNVVIDRALLRRKFARQWGFIESGAYPDVGFG